MHTRCASRCTWSASAVEPVGTAICAHCDEGNVLAAAAADKLALAHVQAKWRDAWHHSPRSSGLVLQARPDIARAGPGGIGMIVSAGFVKAYPRMAIWICDNLPKVRQKTKVFLAFQKYASLDEKVAERAIKHGDPPV